MYSPRHSNLDSGFPTNENWLMGVARRRNCDQERPSQGLARRDGGAGIDTSLRCAYIVQIDVLRKRLISEAVVEIPRAPGVIQTAGEPVRVVGKGRVQVIRIGPHVVSPEGRRIQEIGG